nr:hypothetical protein Y49E10.22 - Caenorhabditis elegans [Caenorhabditis elegans]
MALLLVMGIPASGKSTFRRKIQTAHRELLESTSFDDFRMMRTRSSDKNARQTRKSFECHVESCISESTSKIYVIEDIFYLKSKHGQTHLVLQAATRHATRRKSTPDMAEPKWPSSANSSISIYEGSQKSVDVLSRKIPKSRCNRAPRTKVSLGGKTRYSKKPPPPSKLESLDVLTRRLVSELMQNDKTMNGRKLSDARKKLLIDLSGNLEISNENDPKFLYDLKLKLIEFYDK